MAGNPGIAGSTWNPDSCWMTATTAQMLWVSGRTSSASKAANMSIAHASRFDVLAGMRSRICARARSGSIGASRGGTEPQPASNKAPRARIRQRVVTGATVADSPRGSVRGRCQRNTLDRRAHIPPLAARTLAEMDHALIVVDRHFARAREHVHADEQRGLILQAP